MPLLSSRLGRLSRQRGMRMDLGKREVAKDKAHPVAHSLLQLLHDRVGAAAVRTLVVTVLDQRDGCGRGPFRVVASPDREGQLGRVRLRRQGETSFLSSASRAARIPSAPGFTPTGET